MKKIYVVGEAKHYANFIDNAEIINNIEDADVVIFTGGEDVDPSLYDAKKHITTFSNIQRDLYEKEMFEMIKPNQFVIGICRGSQFLCVMNGGKLIQDCSNHAMFGTHPIFNYLNKTVYEITSTHHQMQYPYNLNREDYTIVAVSHSHRSLDYEGDGIDINNVLQNGEPEIILYHKDNMPKCLAIQGHPEYMRKESPIVKYLNSLIDNTIKTIKNNENN